MKPQDFADTEPRFLPEEYFAGKTRAWGLFQDRFGDVRREFTVDIDGHWDGSVLTLKEDFVYTDGEKEERLWKIQKLDNHHYEGTAEGVIGIAKGQAYGHVLKWSYKYALKVGDSIWNVRFDDWMFLQQDGVMINRATVTKLGFEIGTLTLSFRKISDPETPVAAASAE